MTKAGEILLLVGGILRCVGAVVLIMMALFIGPIIRKAAQSSNDQRGADLAASIVTPLYLVLGLLVGAGGILGILGYRKARVGNFSSAFVLGLVGCLLPPVDVLMLLGAIFVKIGPNQQSHAQAYPPQYPPPYPPAYPPAYPPQAPPYAPPPPPPAPPRKR